MSESREELGARQRACGAVLRDLQETLKEEGLDADGESVSVSGIALQLYLTAYAMKRQYWGASFTMADRFCDFAGLRSVDMHTMAMDLVRAELGEE